MFINQVGLTKDLCLASRKVNQFLNYIFRYEILYWRGEIGIQCQQNTLLFVNNSITLRLSKKVNFRPSYGKHSTSLGFRPTVALVLLLEAGRIVGNRANTTVGLKARLAFNMQFIFFDDYHTYMVSLHGTLAIR